MANPITGKAQVFFDQLKDQGFEVYGPGLLDYDDEKYLNNTEARFEQHGWLGEITGVALKRSFSGQADLIAIMIPLEPTDIAQVRIGAVSNNRFLGEVPFQCYLDGHPDAKFLIDLVGSFEGRTAGNGLGKKSTGPAPSA